MILEWDPDRPRKKITEHIKNTLIEGGIIAYPTDTFYGFGCDLFNIKAIRLLYQIKRLDYRRPMSIICSDFKEISKYAVITDFAFDILRRYLPGPYTFVLKAKKIMPKLLMTDKKEVGIRVPDHPVPIGLVKLIERPVINTSARIAGEDILTDPKEIEKKFKGMIDLVIDGGIIIGEPSTVIRMMDDKVEVLREGKGQVIY
ncbi:MAG TPA: L-threonylcarbamoyladenylate synthase [Syntrophorhabdaceae bacterium]|nr:L-threonylcarbamoyladenylate synthase [Syntrophorhabdaceae bacterium]HPU29898.1 L-threonylcarbamoyladenylate synthase [Syntrophorhabdaceae bacterium]